LGERIVFSGSAGDYVVALPDALRKDERVLVLGADGETEWSIEIVEVDASGANPLLG